MTVARRRAATDDAQRRGFESVYTEHYGPLYAYALRRTDTAHDAADVVAETFLVAWRRLSDAPDGPEMRLWLYGVARRVLANHQRGKHRNLRLVERLRASARPEASTAAPAVDDRQQAIIAAFARLRPDDRDVLILVAVEGLTAGQIAQVLRCTAVAARVRLHRARARLARELAHAGVEV